MPPAAKPTPAAKPPLPCLATSAMPPAAKPSAAAQTQAADVLEAWLKRQPGQKVLLTQICQFYNQYAAAGQTVRSKGIRPFAAKYGQRFQVTGKCHSMAIRATSSHHAGDEERRYDQDGQQYTKVEFIGEYGGTLEWELAEPELQTTPPMLVAPDPLATSTPPAFLDDQMPTENVLLISHTHGRARRSERSISRLELQAAVKHGRKEPAHPSAQGRSRWRYTHSGVVYVTDASSRHEITSWRDDGQDMPVEMYEPGVYGAHVVLIVDASGSMRETDVEGYASRTAAVYECLARELVQPQGTVGFQSHYGNAVVSLIEMSDQAHVLKQQAPMDNMFADYLRHRATSRARSHGNYLPALAKATELLAHSRQDARLFLLFLSDGAPSDHNAMTCSHGSRVWSHDPSVKPDGSGKHPLCPCDHVSNSDVCRQEVKALLKKECCERVTQLGVRFGRERVVVATVAFGDPKGNYSMLKDMAKQLPRGSFHKLGVDASALRTAFSSLSSSLTSLRTESAGGSVLTLRQVQVACDSNAQHRASLLVEGDGWEVSTEVTKLEYSTEHQGLRTVPMDAIGIAYWKTPFAQGAERLAHRGSEVAHSPQELAISSRVCVSGLQNKPQHNGITGRVVGRQGERWQVELSNGEELALRSANLQVPPRCVRKGHWLVTKFSRHAELLNEISFHETFCRLHEEARALAAQFNEQLHGQLSAFSIRFVRCCVYDAVVSGRRHRLLAEQELEGVYLKYNNNAGTVRTTKPRVSTDASEPLGMILEEQDELDEDAALPEPIEAPQCFSHFSFVASGHQKLICDLQGTWNATDGYLFTDPVLHHISLNKHDNGATDKGLLGIEKFFGSHTCGPLCTRLGLPLPDKCIELAQDKLRRLELQKQQEEQQARAEQRLLELKKQRAAAALEQLSKEREQHAERMQEQRMREHYQQSQERLRQQRELHQRMLENDLRQQEQQQHQHQQQPGGCVII